MKKWWREWKSVDIIGLGGGLILVAIYLLLGNKYQQDSAFHSLLPNIATEIIGVWISIRIIERVLSRRDKFHSSRKAVLSDLFYIWDILYKIFPNPSKWQFRTVEDHLEYTIEAWSRRYEFLYDDEAQLVQNCHQLMGKIFQVLEHYFCLVEKVSLTKHQLELEIIHTNRQREQVESSLRRLWALQEYAINHGSVDVRDFVNDLTVNINLSASHFTQSEVESLMNIIEFLSSKSVFTYDELSVFNLTLITEITDSVKKYQTKWYKEIENIQDIIQKSDARNERNWKRKIEELDNTIDENAGSLPNPIFVVVKRFSQPLTELGQHADMFYMLLEEIKGKLFELKLNIYAETSPD